MKKVLLGLGVLVGLLGLAAFVFWFGWLRAPSPEEVCANLSEVMKKETGVDPKGFDKDCVKKTQPPEFGRLPYAKRMKCLRDAKSAADIKTCSPNW
ncbi:MAG: hypothetical protein HOW73_10055 [Polyangiaceae bacterium]|nr:hypothetical protein [Polyangiaceae bacterium]